MTGTRPRVAAEITSGSIFPANERPTHNLGHYLLTEIQHNIGKGTPEYTEVLSWAFEKIGISHFSYVYVGHLATEAEKTMILSNYPKDWVKYYEANALYRKDPIINYTSTTSAAFFWEDNVRRDKSAEHIFDMSAQYGIEQGFTVPIHEPGCNFGSIHLATNKENLEFRKNVNNYLHLILNISYIAHQQRPTSVQPEPYRRLTEREAECLHWVAMGKSYGEIAFILHISERTVKFHAQNIMKKMDSVNIKQAMTKALRMNLI